MCSGKSLIDKNGWVHCPFCNSKTRTKVRADTILKNFPLYCPKCGQEKIVNIEKHILELSTEPDAQTQSR